MYTYDDGLGGTKSINIPTNVGTGTDANGWTTFSHSSDSHVVYVSSSVGSDANDGLSQSSAVASIAKGLSLIRDGSADSLLLKAGDVWVNQEFGFLDFSGRSGTEPIVISSYGTGARPLIETGPNGSGVAIGNVAGGGSNIAIVGLEFYAYTRDPSNPNFAGPGPEQDGFFFLGQVDNLLIEDSKFSFYSVNAIQGVDGMAGDVDLRRNIIVDNYSTNSHAQGLYVDKVSNLVLEQNLFDHNGYNGSVAGADPTVFNHDLYIQDNCGPATLVGNIFANASSHGAQVRSGGTVVNNLFISDPIGLLMGGAEHGGVVSGNVFIAGDDINSSLPRGFGIDVNQTTEPVYVTDNIIAHVASGRPWGHGIQFYTGTADDVATGNIIYEWDGDGAIINGGVSNTIAGNAINLSGYLDPNRGVETYMASIGGSASLAAFLAAARNQSENHWNSFYTADAVNNYIESGFVTSAILPPTIELSSGDSGVQGDGVTNDNTLTLAGTAQANSTVSVYDGATLLGTATANRTGVWSYATSALSNGAHAFSATARDSGGLSSGGSTALNVTVDTTAPAEPTIGSFSKDTGVVGDGITADNTLTFTGSAEAGSTVKVYDGAALLGATLVTDNGAWTFTTAALPDGAHSFTVSAEDVAGNTSAASAALNLKIDRSTPPTTSLSYTDPNNLQAWTSYSATYSGTKITALTYMMDDGTKSSIVYDPYDLDDFADYLVTYNSSWGCVRIIFNYDDGMHTVAAYDIANEYSFKDYLATFDAQWNLVRNIFVNDDGTNSVVNYDVHNEYSWAFEVFDYDANWNLLSRHGVNDNGVSFGNAYLGHGQGAQPADGHGALDELPPWLGAIDHDDAPDPSTQAPGEPQAETRSSIGAGGDAMDSTGTTQGPDILSNNVGAHEGVGPDRPDGASHSVPAGSSDLMPWLGLVDSDRSDPSRSNGTTSAINHSSQDQSNQPRGSFDFDAHELHQGEYGHESAQPDKTPLGIGGDNIAVGSAPQPAFGYRPDIAPTHGDGSQVVHEVAPWIGAPDESAPGGGGQALNGPLMGGSFAWSWG